MLSPGSPPVGELLPDVLFVPLGHLCRTATGVDARLVAAVREIARLVRPGGLVVTEELVAADGHAGVVEPIDLAPDRAVIAAVQPNGARWQVAVTTFVDGAQATSTATLAPHSAAAVDEVLASVGFELVGRWADWSGTNAVGSPWHVAVHRSPPSDWRGAR